MKLEIVLLAVGIPLLAFGGEKLYHAAGNPQQTTMTCEQFARERGRALWIRVTDCEIDYLGAGYSESGGRINEIFFPVRPAGQVRTEPAALVAATDDPDVLAIARDTMGENRQPDQEAFLVMMLRIVTMLKAAREVEGYARAGAVELLMTRRALAGLNTPLRPGYVVLDLHSRPSVLMPSIAAGAGAATLLAAVFVGLRRKATPLPEPVAEAAQPPPAVELPSLVPRLPAMMLLNLDEGAGVEAIEHAPPLGSREEVAARLGEALGGLEFAEGRRATFEGPNFSLIVDLGPHEPVWTVTVEPSGSSAFDAALTLAGRTGWRLYVPKQGMFVDSPQIQRASGR